MTDFLFPNPLSLRFFHLLALSFSLPPRPLAHEGAAEAKIWKEGVLGEAFVIFNLLLFLHLFYSSFMC